MIRPDDQLSNLRAGAAMVDITPALGIQIDGDIGRPRPTEEVRDPLYAKALVLDDGRRKLCVLSLDLLAIQNGPSDTIRHRAAERFGFDADAVMVHVTQNHSAPGIGHFVCRDECDLIKPEHAWLRMGDDRYTEFALERILQAVELANADLRPAKVGAGSGLDPRGAFNRRYVLRDGTTMTNPGGEARKNILHVEGPTDPEVGVVSINNTAGVLALLLHHTCHPAHGYPTRYITADWPGRWTDGMKGITGLRCVPLVVNGCCGNILHINWPDPHWVDDQYRMGRQLTETASEVLAGIERYEERVPLDFVSRKIQIPMREFDPTMIEDARQLLRENPEPMWLGDTGCVDWRWLYAVGRVDIAAQRERYPFYDYEVQAFRIGEIALLALVGEPFVEAQLKIKLESPVRHTYVAHMSNGYVGYIPTAHAIEAGGYETWPGGWSRLAPEALDMITDESLRLLRELFPEKPAQRPVATGYAI
jgi:hypothetical protein